MSGQPLTSSLVQGLEELGEDPAAHPCDLYLRYVEELIRWNKAYNLTAIREPGRMLSHHILDSLSILPYLHGQRCLDAGTGPGLPGLPLALARPESRWTLLDSKIKKVRFLHHAVRELGARRVEIVHGRVETFRPERGFDTIVSRAFTSLGGFYRLAGPLMAPGGRLLAMKGELPPAELAEIPAGAGEVIELKVPGVEAKRQLVIIRGGLSLTPEPLSMQ